MTSTSQPITLTLPLAPSPQALAELRDLLKVFEEACDLVHKMANEHQLRHQATLHNLAYRVLCPKRSTRKDQIPSQLAIRAISRVSHQLRCLALKIGDPYPPSSLDFDARSLSIDVHQGLVEIASLRSVGLRGQNRKFARLKISAHFKTEDKPLWHNARFLGGHMVLPPKGPAFLIARLAPEPELLDALDEASLLDLQGHA